MPFRDLFGIVIAVSDRRPELLPASLYRIATSDPLGYLVISALADVWGVHRSELARLLYRASVDALQLEAHSEPWADPGDVLDAPHLPALLAILTERGEMCSQPETEDLPRAAYLVSVRRRVRAAIERENLLAFLNAPPFVSVDLERYVTHSATVGLGT